MGREKIKHIGDREEVRKKNVRDHFLTYSQALRPWLKELVAQYKESQNFPLFPMSILPSYFDRTEDKEVAAFVALLIPETDNVIKNIGEVRSILGKEPWEWLRTREFIRLGMGTMQNKRTGGVENWKIAKLCDRLWGECCGHGRSKHIGETVSEICQIQRCSYFGCLTYLVEDCCVGNYDYKLRLLLLVLATCDGFGIGLWSVSPEDLKSPLTHDLRTFLQTWFPDYRRFGTVDDAIGLFFDRACDFFYCYLAYKELQKKKPKECGEFATTYRRWYETGVIKKPYQFREILPEI